MKCPTCDVNLVMSERQGVEIDYCPECRGVWLDRGELDKIIEKTNQGFSEPQRERYEEPSRSSYNERPDHEDRGRYDEKNGFKKKKRENILADLFDFGG